MLPHLMHWLLAINNAWWCLHVPSLRSAPCFRHFGRWTMPDGAAACNYCTLHSTLTAAALAG